MLASLRIDSLTRTRGPYPLQQPGWPSCAAFTIPAVAQSSDAKVSIAPRAASRIPPTSPTIGPDSGRRQPRIYVGDRDGFQRSGGGIALPEFPATEDGVEQKVSEFFRGWPVSIGGPDLSEYMRPAATGPKGHQRVSTLDRTQRRVLLRYLWRPGGACARIHSQRRRYRKQSTDSSSGLDGAIRRHRSGIQHMKKASQSRRVLLVFPDGADNNSRFSEEVRSMVRGANAPCSSAEPYAFVRQACGWSGGRCWSKRITSMNCRSW